MKIIIIHHHLNPGGVNRIVEMQSKILSKVDNFHIKLITGKCPIPSWIQQFNLSIKQNKLLDYLNPNIKSKKILQQLYIQIISFLKKEISKDSIIHIHNPNLGKNPLLMLALHQLCLNNYQIIKHIHDFCEDLRSELYQNQKLIIQKIFKQPLAEVMYPNRPNVFYITINSRDTTLLKKMNIFKKQIFYLPNAIHFEKQNPKSLPLSKKDFLKKLNLNIQKPLIVYPIRAIRRKNIGEFILIATLLKKSAQFALSLAPENPIEKIAYNAWVKFSKKHQLPIKYNIGQLISFENLMQIANKVITTSVCEGFGMIFLEPWQYNLNLFGRDLPEITIDIKKKGFKQLSLYKHFWIPNQDPIEASTLKNEYQKLYTKIYNDFSLPIPTNLDKVIKNSKCKGSYLDFANLSIEMQMKIIEKTIASKPYELAISKKNNKILKETLNFKSNEDNKKIITQFYSSTYYLNQLTQIYKKIIINKKIKKIKKINMNNLENNVKFFLHSKNIHLIRN